MTPTLYMAPVRGITNYIYRGVYSRLFDGYDRCVTPFVKSSKGRKGSLKDILPERNKVSFELIPQILGNDTEGFISLAIGMFDLGYKTVNWNLGCPLPMIRKKRRGSGLLPFPHEIVKFLEEVIPHVPGRVSLKVRLGAEEKGDLAILLPLLNGLPLEEIIIHPRTGKQMYDGEVDMLSFEEALSLTEHPIVYSGDIGSVEKFEALAKRFPMIDRWMIGRGGIIDPFLPEEIKGLKGGTEQEKMDRFIKFHEAIFAAYQEELSGPAHLVGKMKENWRYWAMAFEGSERLFLNISRARKTDGYLRAVEKFFSGKPKLRIRSNISPRCI